MVMSVLVKFLSLSNPLELCSDHFPTGFARNGILVRILLFRYMELGHPPKYIFKNNVSSKIQIFDQLRPDRCLFMLDVYGSTI